MLRGVRAWVGIRDANGGLGRGSAAIEESECNKPAKDRPDVGQVPFVPLAAREGGRDGSPTKSRSKRMIEC